MAAVDNYQEEPREQTAHRTSPTNIGLMLLVDALRLRPRLPRPERAVAARAPRVRQHRAPGALPRAISSTGTRRRTSSRSSRATCPRSTAGTSPGACWRSTQGCQEVAARTRRPRRGVGRARRRARAPRGGRRTRAPRRRSGSLRSVLVRDAPARPSTGAPILAAPTRRCATLCDDLSAELDRELLEFLDTGAHRHEAELLHALRTWIDRLHQQLQQMRRELETLLPWLALADEPAAAALELPAELRLDEIPAVARSLRAELEAWEPRASRARRAARGARGLRAAGSPRRLRSAERARGGARAASSLALAARAEREVRGMDFRLLFDRERKLFHIGYNVDARSARRAPLRPPGLGGAARELPRDRQARRARVALVRARPADDGRGRRAGAAVVGRHDVRVPDAEAPDAEPARARCSRGPASSRSTRRSPTRGAERALGHLRVRVRPARRASDVPVPIVRRARARLQARPRGRSRRRAVRVDARRCRSGRAPSSTTSGGSRRWGCSGPTACSRRSISTAERAAEGRSFAVVRSYMAHHQGMILVALDNYADRPHRWSSGSTRTRSVETGELLLDEHAPRRRAARVADRRRAWSSPAPSRPRPRRTAPAPWSAERPRPSAGVRARQRPPVEPGDRCGRRRPSLARPRAHALPARLHPRRRRRVDLPARRGQRPRLARHLRATAGRRTRCTRSSSIAATEGISVHVEVAVAPADDVEVRHVTLHNETGSAPAARRHERGAARAARRAAGADPSRVLAACSSRASGSPSSTPCCSRAALGPRRRRRAVLVHRLVREGRGRRRSRATRPIARRSSAVAGARARPRRSRRRRGALRGRAGAVLDPVMSLMASVELKPKRSVTLAFVTTVGALAQRRARARPALRVDARGALGVPRCRAGEPAAAAARRGSIPRCCRRSSACSRRCCSPIRRCARRPRLAAARPCKRAAVGARDLRRRSDRARARARPRGAAARRDARGAALPSLVRRAARSRARRRAGLGIRQRGLGDAAQRARPARRRRLAQPARRHLRARGRSGLRRRAPPPRGERPRRARHARWLARARAGARAGERPAEAAAVRADARRGGRSRRRVRAPTLALRQRHRRLHARTAASTCISVSPGRADAGAVVQRAREPRLRLPRERVVARRHVVAQQRREPAHAVEKRSGPRYALRGPLPAGRGDRGGLVADAAARRARRARRSCATARATRSTSERATASSRRSRSSSRPMRRSRSCGCGSRTRSPGTGG